MKRRQSDAIIPRWESVGQAETSDDAISKNDLLSTLICRGETIHVIDYVPRISNTSIFIAWRDEYLGFQTK
jgi:hypothetical protein